METLILTAHVIIAVLIVTLVLLQHGKGADAGATFGAGNSGTVFGAAGSGNFLSRSTAVLTAIFFASSLGLAVMAKNKNKSLYELEHPASTSSEKEAESASDNKDANKGKPTDTQMVPATPPAKPAEQKPTP